MVFFSDYYHILQSYNYVLFLGNNIKYYHFIHTVALYLSEVRDWFNLPNTARMVEQRPLDFVPI